MKKNKTHQKLTLKIFFTKWVNFFIAAKGHIEIKNGKKWQGLTPILKKPKNEAPLGGR